MNFTKLKNSKIYKIQTVTTLKNSKYVISNCDKPQKLELQQNQNTDNGTKLKTENCYKTKFVTNQRLKL